MKKMELYTNWLMIVSVLIVIFGLALALLKDTLLSAMIRAIFDPAFWPTGLNDAGTTASLNFSLSLLGAQMVTWGILLLGIVNYGFKKGEPWAWLFILLSTLGWFIIDEGFSIYYKVWVNVIGNIPLFFLLIFPLVLSYKPFFGANRS